MPVNHPVGFTFSSQRFSRWKLNMYRFVLSHVVYRPLLLLGTTRWRCGAATARIRPHQRDAVFLGRGNLESSLFKASLTQIYWVLPFFLNKFSALVALWKPPAWWTNHVHPLLFDSCNFPSPTRDELPTADFLGKTSSFLLPEMWFHSSNIRYCHSIYIFLNNNIKAPSLCGASAESRKWKVCPTSLNSFTPLT